MGACHDPAFPHITYRQGASGQPVAVQTLAIAAHQWGMTPEQMAAEYGLTAAQINDALGFYTMHQTEIEAAIAAERAIESAHI